MASAITTTQLIGVDGQAVRKILSEAMQAFAGALRSIDDWRNQHLLEARIRAMSEFQLRDIGIHRAEVANTLIGPTRRY